MSHIELTLSPVSNILSDLLVAELTALGFTGFLEEENQLKAYVPLTDFDAAGMGEWASLRGLDMVWEALPEQNWNAAWEASFEPVVVEDKVGIRADFHPPFLDLAQELVITPKMSFGTGHHGTTHGMISLMLKLDLKQKRVFDFGTGTGILAILAEKLGANQVLAVDNDDWSIRNAAENIARNGCQTIQLEEVSDQYAPPGPFEVVLANVNRHILEAKGHVLVNALAPGGQVLASGLLTEDEEPMKTFFTAKGLFWQETKLCGNWIAMCFNAAQANVK
ncbi:MAG: 50S ribosomal protein L11 methyltransferase [Sphingobacteriia bacterium]|nr:MAG: 50S ribosomal protein L11 methyltransferase [Sphingobacteriia bacterium]